MCLVETGGFLKIFFFKIRQKCTCKCGGKRAIKSSLYCRELIFCYENKGLDEIITFYFNGGLISKTLCSMQQVISFQLPTRPFFPKKSTFKNKMIDFAHHCT
jgi:hypothetical protein